MDSDDLFMDFEDDALEQSMIFVENAISQDSRLLTEFTCFHCVGSDCPSSTFHKHGFIKRNELQKSDPIIVVGQQYNIMDIQFDVTLFDRLLPVLINKARMSIDRLVEKTSNSNPIKSMAPSKSIGDLWNFEDDPDWNIVQDLHVDNEVENSYWEMRYEISSLLHLVKNSLDYISEDALGKNILLLQKRLEGITSIPNIDINFAAFSAIGNACPDAAFHLLHGHLEWKLLHLLILHKQLMKADNMNCDIQRQYEELLQLLIYDLSCLSSFKFKKLSSMDVIKRTPFPCTCVKEVWLALQLLLENLKNKFQMKSFWFYFNSAIFAIRDGKDMYSNYETTQEFSHNQVPNLDGNWIQFSLWMLSGVAKLHAFSEDGNDDGKLSFRIDSNYTLLESLIKMVFESDPSEDQLRFFCCLMVPIVADWWEPKVEIAMILWEYFYKNLNSSFFILNASLDNLAVASPTAWGYLNQAQNQLGSNELMFNQSSFSMFTHLIGHLFQKLLSVGQNGQILKIMGRIYSKFTAAKMISLTEMGFHNVISLFLMLCLAGDSPDIIKRIQELLLQINLDRLDHLKKVGVSKAHMALLILNIQKGINIKSHAQKFINQVNSIKDDYSALPVIKVLSDGLKDVLNVSDTFDSGQSALIDSWISKYLQISSSAEQERLLETLNILLLKNASGCNMDLIALKFIYQKIVPFLKVRFTSEPSLWAPQLAANLCLCASGDNGLPEFNDLFRSLTEINNANMKNVLNFLLALLSSEKSDKLDQSVIIRQWIKCSVLLQNAEVAKDLKILATKVASLEEFKAISNLQMNDIINTENPSAAFFVAIGQMHRTMVTDVKKQMWISEKLHSYLQSFEKWALPAADMPQSIVDYIYKFITVVVFHCTSIVYVKSKSSCFFNASVVEFVLPSQLLIGKTPAQNVVQAMHKVWNALVEAIGKVDFKKDFQLLKTLSNLVVKWLPHFRISANISIVAKPYIKCFMGKNDSLTYFVFETIAKEFIIVQDRRTHDHACLALTIVTQVFTSIKKDFSKLDLYLRSLGESLLIHAMLVEDLAIVPSRKIVFDLLKEILQFDGMRQCKQLRDVFCISLRSLAEKYISHHAVLYFALLTQLIRLNRKIVENVIGHARDQVAIVELNNGVGYDPKLRSSLERLEAALVENNRK